MKIEKKNLKMSTPNIKFLVTTVPIKTGGGEYTDDNFQTQIVLMIGS